MENRIKEFENILDKLIEKYNLSESRETIITLAQETIILRLSEKEDYKKLGNTRILGTPDLPISISKSEFEDGEWFFLSQLNLSEIQGVNSILPDQGMLYFFVDYGKGKVIYSPNYELKKYIERERDFKINFPPDGEKPRIEIIKTFPYSHNINGNYDYDEMQEELLEIIGDYEASIFGYFGVDCNIRTYNPLTGGDISKKYNNSILLFHQIDPLGRDAYFLINEEDLLEKRFNKVFYSHFAG